MLKTILCATDFSEHFRFTIDWGIWLSRWFSAHMLVFHAVPSTQDIMFASDITATGRSVDADIEQTRRRLESLMGNQQVDWEPLVAHGDSVETLIPLVASRDIDLVVAASYGLSGIKRMLLGTIVERMARSLDCPLWVVRAGGGPPPERGIRQMVVACDFTEASTTVIRTAARLADAFGAQVRLVHAMEAPLDEKVVEPTTGPYEKVQQQLTERLVDRLQRRFPASSAPNASVRTVALQGHPGEQIPLYAAQCSADLIVVGVRQLSRVEKVFRGSTTEALLRRSPCAVLAVPVGEEAAPPADGPERPRR